MATERTPLQPSRGTPSYVVTADDEDVYYTPRNRHLKQFQCCICLSLITAAFCALIIAIGYSILNPETFANDLNVTELDVDLNVSVSESDPFNLAFLVVPIEDEPSLPWSGPNVTQDELDSVIQEANLTLLQKLDLEDTLFSPPTFSPTFKHQKSVATSRKARLLSHQGFIEDEATKILAKRHGTSRPHSSKKRWNIGKGPAVGSDVQNATQCDFNSKFRTIDGSCNSRLNPHSFGVAFRPFRRAILPDYADGISSPRASVTSTPLPTAREVSLQVHRPSYEVDPYFTVMLAVWGQFLDHDITATASSQGANGSPIECCNLPKDVPVHPECFPVPIVPADPFYQQFNVTCMNFVRSAPAPDGRMGPREQMNQASAFIDGSVVYGNTRDKQSQLRTFENGTLKMLMLPNQRTLLPVSKDPNDGCNRDEMNARERYCFDSGDARANENLHLTSMHLIWARHHNFLVRNLARVNPHWDDERLFQEGRKILGAQMQHITYNEFLSVVLGKTASKHFEIISNPQTGQDLYRDQLDPTIANHFAAAAFRFAHTLLPRLFFITRNTSTPEGIAMHKMLFNPYSLYNDNGLDQAMDSALNTPLEPSDPFFNTELKNNLFSKPTTHWNASAPCGLDLVSLNIQRGRDHGLPPYPEFRKYCNLPEAETWEQIAKYIDPDSLKRMRQIYKVPENIDVYTGGLSETPMGGGILGPLFTCLIGEQFYRLKFGDAFWFERQKGPQKFSKPQLEQIYGTLLSSVICRNSDNVTFVQQYVMKRSGSTNRLVDCAQLETFNFEPWREPGFTRVPTFQEAVRVLVLQGNQTEAPATTENITIAP